MGRRGRQVILRRNAIAAAGLAFPVWRLALDGLLAWTQVVEGEYEGYVAKDEASVYEAGPTRRRLKVKQKDWTVAEEGWRRRISVAAGAELDLSRHPPYRPAMDRRRFLLTSLVGVLAAPLAAEAQQAGKVYRIGYLTGGSPSASAPFLDAFREGLHELGYIEGRNIIIEYRWAEGKLERLPELAAELVGRKVDVILTAAPPSAQAAHQATRTIPIVIIGVGDPVALGLATSLSRPGGNVTGYASYGRELVGKTLELLKEIVPGVKRVAIIWSPANAIHVRNLKDVEEGPARLLAIQILPLKIVSPSDFEDAFRTAVSEHAGAVWIFGEPMFTIHRAWLASLALNARLPTMHFSRQHVEAGGLASYGPDILDQYRHAAASYIDKILKGSKPADLPVEQPTKFELVINMKTAKALGLTIPPSLLLRADQVIE